jgi:hypothetical protein
MTGLQNGFAFICGRIRSDSGDSLRAGIIRLRNGQRLEVDSHDPGLAYLKAGRIRMVVARGGKIIAVFGRPRIKLLLMLGNGVSVTQDLIDCYSPMYPRPEKIFRSTMKWKGSFDHRFETGRL